MEKKEEFKAFLRENRALIVAVYIHPFVLSFYPY